MSEDVCVMCGQPVGKRGVVYPLTEQERHTMRVLLQNDGDVHYCLACDRISKDPHAFAQFMKGVKLTQLRADGVPVDVAEHAAQREYDFYLDKALESRGKKPAS